MYGDNMNIEINLKNESDAFNTFNENKISENLDNYLMTYLEHMPLKDNLTLTITGTDNNNISKIIKEYYKEKYFYLHKLDIYDNFIRSILFIIGFIAILISKKFTNILGELFLIAGWVVIWEIIYDILFNEIRRKRKAKIYKTLANSNIIMKK